MPLFRFKCTFKERGEYVGGCQRMVFGRHEAEARSKVIDSTNLKNWDATTMLVTHIGHYWIPVEIWDIFQFMSRATVGETDDPATTQIQYCILGADLDGYGVFAYSKYGENLHLVKTFMRDEEGMIPTWSRPKMPILEFRVTGLGAYRCAEMEAVYLDLHYRETVLFPLLHAFWR